jgi:transcriptional regulator with XRE-family HTH domain
MKKMAKKDESLKSRLKAIRHALDLSQKEFAGHIKISAPSYSEIETGKYKPKFDVIQKIGKAFNVNLYYLVYGEGEMFIDPSHPFFKRIEGARYFILAAGDLNFPEGHLTSPTARAL